jgi:excisionase family DNA binding protein
MESRVNEGVRADVRDELLTVNDMATWLKVPRSWVYERTRRRRPDRLPFVKLGKYVRFERGAVLEYLARQRRSA